MKKVKVIDLFCWIWWLTHWLVNEWFDVVAWIDNEKSCKFAFEKNNRSHFFDMDIKDVTSVMLNDLYWDADIKILVWCAPCQPFSRINTQKWEYNLDEIEARSPIRKFADLIKEMKPEIVSMENVAWLVNIEKYPSFHYFLNVLKDNGYWEPYYKIVDCTKYWIPQTRKRLVLLASRLWPIELIPETHQKPVTLKKIIWRLEKIEAWEQSKKDSLHRSRNLDDINMRRIKAIPKNWGSLLDLTDDTLLPECHKKASGKTYIGNVYARMRWDKPAPTMTTWCTWLGNGRFGHPEQNRAISLREASLIQTFPKSYIFFDDKNNPWISRISKHIGNAVPVRLWEIIGKSINKHLIDFNS